MPTNPPSPTGNTVQSYPPCVEHGVWTPIPVKPPDNALEMKLKDVDPGEARAVKERGVMTFHAVGCSGDFEKHEPGLAVADAMAAQISKPGTGGGSAAAVGASFLFHLGDVVYKDEDPTNALGKDQATMYTTQFYGQFEKYGREIFAIAGNHDGKSSAHAEKSPIDHFLENFCDSKRRKSPDSKAVSSKRLTMNQPYPYWLFETALCYIVGLYTNDINGGNWTIRRLQAGRSISGSSRLSKPSKPPRTGKSSSLRYITHPIPGRPILLKGGIRILVRHRGTRRLAESCTRWVTSSSTRLMTVVNTRMSFCRRTRTFTSGSLIPM